MKAYKCCEKASEAKQLIPSSVVQITKLGNNVPKNGNWGGILDETWIWTRSLFYTSLELPIWADHIPAYLGNCFTHA
jgi:hypothetical protein